MGAQTRQIDGCYGKWENAAARWKKAFWLSIIRRMARTMLRCAIEKFFYHERLAFLGGLGRGK
jgi:hypothetical protein